MVVEVIFLGTIQELPDSNTIDCDDAGGKQQNYIATGALLGTSDPSHVLIKAETWRSSSYTQKHDNVRGWELKGLVSRSSFSATTFMD